jgi:hypothetical protein
MLRINREIKNKKKAKARKRDMVKNAKESGIAP